MNKYQVALNDLFEAVEKNTNLENVYLYKKNLQELIDKATPMKPQIFIQDRGFDIEICPNCKGSIHALKYWHEINERGNYCDLCGQKLDWGDKND